MAFVVEAAWAKINLALHVLGKRLDGYHEIDSVVAFADVGDVVRIEPTAKNQLIVSGPFARDTPLGDDNIIWKAWAVLNAIMPLPQVLVHLTKNLPVASGVGGGSADAAAMVRGLLHMVGATLSEKQIAGLSSIGADVPVCFVGKPAQITGIGEKITLLEELLPPAVVLVNPLVACSTAQVFAAMGLKPGEMRALPTRAEWRNDMTVAASQTQPLISHVLSALHKTQLHPVLMSGSGATCFGIARDFAEAEIVAVELQRLHPEWWVRAARLG